MQKKFIVEKNTEKKKKREMRSRTLTSKGTDTKKDSPAPS